VEHVAQLCTVCILITRGGQTNVIRIIPGRKINNASVHHDPDNFTKTFTSGRQSSTRRPFTLSPPRDSWILGSTLRMHRGKTPIRGRILQTKAYINTSHDKSVPLKPLINYKMRIDHLNNYARSAQFLAIHQGVSCLCPGVVPLNVIERKHVLKPELNRDVRAHLPASAPGCWFNGPLFPPHRGPRASRTFQLHTFQK
jgi:hypothetical protein